MRMVTQKMSHGIWRRLTAGFALGFVGSISPFAFFFFDLGKKEIRKARDSEEIGMNTGPSLHDLKQRRDEICEEWEEQQQIRSNQRKKRKQYSFSFAPPRRQILKMREARWHPQPPKVRGRNGRAKDQKQERNWKGTYSRGRRDEKPEQNSLRKHEKKHFFFFRQPWRGG
jgi:hypothetical protein